MCVFWSSWRCRFSDGATRGVVRRTRCFRGATPNALRSVLFETSMSFSHFGTLIVASDRAAPRCAPLRLAPRWGYAGQHGCCRRLIRGAREILLNRASPAQPRARAERPTASLLGTLRASRCGARSASTLGVTENQEMSMIVNFAELMSAQLKGLLADPGSVSSFLYSEDGNRSAAHVDLDKAWHGIHFLFTGEVWRRL